jgi:hypothetical protein
MKPLTLFLFLSLSLSGFGQESVPIRWFLPEDTIRQKLDTVAVWLEYADSLKPISYNMTQPGYDVRKLVYLPLPVWIDDCTFKTADWVHVSYLNRFKQPFPYLVWGTKERREK